MGRPIGVLAFQGGVAPHCDALRDVGAEPIEVRDAATLARVQGLVVPGGESTAIILAIARASMADALSAFVREGHPTLTTCAGTIVAARPEFGWLDIGVERNGYGPQSHSRCTQADDGRTALVLIRAPKITAVGPQVQVLARLGGDPVLVRQGTVTGATFHPELTTDRSLHATLFA